MQPNDKWRRMFEAAVAVTLRNVFCLVLFLKLALRRISSGGWTALQLKNILCTSWKKCWLAGRPPLADTLPCTVLWEVYAASANTGAIKLPCYIFKVIFNLALELWYAGSSHSLESWQRVWKQQRLWSQQVLFGVIALFSFHLNNFSFSVSCARVQFYRTDK